MFKKILLILLFSLNFFIQTSTTILLPSTYVNNSTDEFFEMISQYESFNEKLFDLYYQEYQVNNNIILSLNKVNYPNFFNDQKIYNSLTFKGGLFVNKNYYLKNNYIPDTLIPVTITKINRKQETMLIDKTTLTYAKAMFDEASSKGLNLVVFSAYRSYIKQNEIYNKASDKNYVAQAGFSEHQTGKAIDIATLDTGLSIHFENTKEYEYLTKNAHRFGFIKRYPKDKENVTKYPYESWHYRFVGQDLATFIYENNLTLEEYIYMYVELK